MGDFAPMETENLLLRFVSVQRNQMKQWIWLYTVKIGAILIMVLERLLMPLFWIRFWKSIKKIPSVDDEIFKISATKLARMIRQKEISSEELIRRYIRRINEVNPIINAVVQDRFTEAIHEASVVDEWLKETSLTIDEIERGYPLLGVPITVKESCKLKGMSFSVGINTRKGMIANEDGEAVKRVKTAGAIPLLVSNTPEVCFGIESDNFITGTCNNPYNTNYTCGGSSGGEGALLGAACSILSVGSDLACSIRVPALFNGVFGHKPSPKLVPNRDHYPFIDDEDFANFLVLGPLARYSEDLRLLLKVISNNKLNLDEKVDLKDVNVYYNLDFDNLLFVTNVKKDIRMAMRKCAEHLKNAHHSKVHRTKLIDLDKCFDMSLALFFGVKNKPDLLRDQNNPSKRYSMVAQLLKLIVNRSTLNYNSLFYDLMVKVHSLLAIKNNDYYHELLNSMRAKLTDTLGPNGILLYPTMPGTAFQHKTSIFNVAGIVYSMIFNILGFPATHVPLGLNRKGLPIGIQVIACPNRDVLCLSVAEELEAKFGGWVPPPSS